MFFRLDDHLLAVFFGGYDYDWETTLSPNCFPKSGLSVDWEGTPVVNHILRRWLDPRTWPLLRVVGARGDCVRSDLWKTAGDSLRPRLNPDRAALQVAEKDAALKGFAEPRKCMEMLKGESWPGGG